MAEKKKGLGRGLGSLIKEDIVVNNEAASSAVSANTVLSVDINKITPNKDQPRKSFDESSLDELAESIKGKEARRSADAHNSEGLVGNRRIDPRGDAERVRRQRVVRKSNGVR